MISFENRAHGNDCGPHGLLRITTFCLEAVNDAHFSGIKQCFARMKAMRLLHFRTAER